MTHTTTNFTNPLTSSYNYHDNQNHDISRYFGSTLVPVDANVPIAKQIENTILDFKLELKPVYYKSPEGFKEHKGRRFLVNSATGENFDIVGEHWQPHQPLETLEAFQDWCSEQPELNLTHIGSLEGGKIVYGLADYPRAIDFGGDRTVAKVLLSNFNKLGYSTRIDLFTYRIVCRNGLTVRSTENSIRLNHTQKDSLGDRLTNSLNQLHVKFSNYQENMTELTKINMGKSEAIALLIKNFGDANLELDEQPKSVQAILQLFEGKAKGSEYLSAYNTAYGLLQASTEYINHHTRHTKTHLSSVLWGGKNNKQQQVMQSLVSTYL